MENEIKDINRTLDLILANQQKIYESNLNNKEIITEIVSIMNMQSQSLNFITNQVNSMTKGISDINIQLYQNDDGSNDVINSLQDIMNELSNVKNKIDNIKIYKMVEY